jgi:hypothetical protein
MPVSFCFQIGAAVLLREQCCGTFEGGNGWYLMLTCSTIVGSCYTKMLVVSSRTLTDGRISGEGRLLDIVHILA